MGRWSATAGLSSPSCGRAPGRLGGEFVDGGDKRQQVRKLDEKSKLVTIDLDS
ncbi:hypothetical protein ACPEIC_40735 [Stenotrophomonas sp. NPDC087984]